MLRFIRITSLFAAALAMSPAAASAQEWITKAACELPGPGEYSPQLAQKITDRARHVENGVGRFWRITSPDGAVSHLWGTMHAAQPAMLQMPQKLLQVMADTQVVAVERGRVLNSRAELARHRDQSWRWRKQPADPPLGHIGPQVAEWVKARLLARGLTERQLPHLTEAGVVTTLLHFPCNDFSAFALPEMDAALAAAAIHGADMVELEPYTDVLKVLSRPANAALVRMLTYEYAAFIRPDNFHERFRAYAGLYHEGRIADLLEYERADLSSLYGAVDADTILSQTWGYLVDRRNLTFFDNALPLLDEGDALLVVGAAHLPGQKGLVTMFRNAGYQVDRVRTAHEAE